MEREIYIEWDEPNMPYKKQQIYNYKAESFDKIDLTSIIGSRILSIKRRDSGTLYFRILTEDKN